MCGLCPRSVVRFSSLSDRLPSIEVCCMCVHMIVNHEQFSGTIVTINLLTVIPVKRVLQSCQLLILLRRSE